MTKNRLSLLSAYLFGSDSVSAYGLDSGYDARRGYVNPNKMPSTGICMMPSASPLIWRFHTRPRPFPFLRVPSAMPPQKTTNSRKPKDVSRPYSKVCGLSRLSGTGLGSSTSLRAPVGHFT
jgi:hypothetical protein